MLQTAYCDFKDGAERNYSEEFGKLAGCIATEFGQAFSYIYLIIRP